MLKACIKASHGLLNYSSISINGWNTAKVLGICEAVQLYARRSLLPLIGPRFFIYLGIARYPARASGIAQEQYERSQTGLSQVAATVTSGEAQEQQ